MDFINSDTVCHIASRKTGSEEDGDRWVINVTCVENEERDQIFYQRSSAVFSNTAV